MQWLQLNTCFPKQYRINHTGEFPYMWDEKTCRWCTYERMRMSLCQRDCGRTAPLAWGLQWQWGWKGLGPSIAPCVGTCLGMGHTAAQLPLVLLKHWVCVVNGVTCLFGSDPPLFFYLLCFSASLWTSSLLLLPIAYLPSILLYDNKSMWVNSDFSQIQQDNWILPHSFQITWNSN